MDTDFRQIRDLVKQRKVRFSAHAYARMAKRGILAADILVGMSRGEVIENYPDFHYGRAMLVLQADSAGHTLHVVWGLEKGTTEPAIVVTAYYPDPAEWSADYRSRK